MTDDVVTDFERDGVTLLPGYVPKAVLDELRAIDVETGERRRGGRRNVLEEPAVRAAVDLLRPTAERLGGGGMRCVRGLMFDKTPGRNWGVAWHQDRSIAVAGRAEVAGYGPWSGKAGVDHVEPPAGVLARVVTLRLHLDDCPADNGPLRTLPGGHRFGVLSDDALQRLRGELPEQAHPAAAGEVLAMRPLTPHASSPAARPARRRVLHLEFSPDALPAPLAWRWRV